MATRIVPLGGRTMMNSESRSWLVQRLLKPFESDGHNEDSILHKLGSANPFAFGGGLVNGGFTTEAMQLMNKLFRFDYMGSAEFEFGAVPKAFRKLIDSNLVTLQMPVQGKADSLNEHKYPGTVGAEVYVICDVMDKDEIIRRLVKWALNKPSLKDPMHFGSSIVKDAAGDKCNAYGWFELNNGFMFFIDKTMFEGVAELLGVKHYDKDVKNGRGKTM